jgi:hypothetical protein
MNTVQRLVVWVLPVRFRMKSLLQLEQEHVASWARMARSLPVTSAALAASFGCSASDVSTTIDPIPRDAMPPWDTKPQWDAMPQWDAVVLLRDAVSQ